MLNFKVQQKFIQKGLSLKEAFLLLRIASFSRPLKIIDIINLNPILDIKERQLKLILKKLEDKNLLTKQRTKDGLYFYFPYLNAINHPYKKRKKCNKTPQKHILKCKIWHKTYFNNILYKLNLKDNHKVDKQNFFPKSPSLKTKQELKKVFKDNFPTKSNYLAIELPKNFNQHLFIEKIKQSPFLKNNDKLSLTWLLKKYDAIISDYYAPHPQKEATKITEQPFSSRTYSKEFLDSLFDTLDNIEV